MLLANEFLLSLNENAKKYAYFKKYGIPSFLEQIKSPTSSIIKMPDHEGAGMDQSVIWNEILSAEKSNYEFFEKYKKFEQILSDEQKLLFQIHFVDGIPKKEIRSGKYSNKMRTYSNVYKKIDQILLRIAVMDDDFIYSQKDYEEWLMSSMIKDVDQEVKLNKLTILLLRDNPSKMDIYKNKIPSRLYDVLMMNVYNNQKLAGRDYDRKKMAILMVRFLVDNNERIKITKEHLLSELKKIPRSKHIIMNFFELNPGLFEGDNITNASMNVGTKDN